MRGGGDSKNVRRFRFERHRLLVLLQVRISVEVDRFVRIDGHKNSAILRIDFVRNVTILERLHDDAGVDAAKGGEVIVLRHFAAAASHRTQRERCGSPAALVREVGALRLRAATPRGAEGRGKT